MYRPWSNLQMTLYSLINARYDPFSTMNCSKQLLEQYLLPLTVSQVKFSPRLNQLFLIPLFSKNIRISEWRDNKYLRVSEVEEKSCDEIIFRQLRGYDRYFNRWIDVWNRAILQYIALKLYFSKFRTLVRPSPLVHHPKYSEVQFLSMIKRTWLWRVALSLCIEYEMFKLFHTPMYFSTPRAKYRKNT